MPQLPVVDIFHLICYDEFTKKLGGRHMNKSNELFINGGGENDSLIAALSTGNVSFKTVYQARHFGRFRSFHLKRMGTAEVACLFVVSGNGGVLFHAC